MRRWLVGAGAALVLASTSVALAAEPLGAPGARLLLTRAGFAPNDADVAGYARLSHAAAVDRLLSGVRTTAVTPSPAWIDERFIPPRELRSISGIHARPRENQSRGTGHGTAGALFAFGPHVRAGVHGAAPSLRVLQRRFDPLPFIS